LLTKDEVYDRERDVQRGNREARPVSRRCVYCALHVHVSSLPRAINNAAGVQVLEGRPKALSRFKKITHNNVVEQTNYRL